MAVLFGVIEVTHQLTKTEEQVTYSVTLESLALGNGETDGENGGTTGGGGSTDGESDGGTGGGTTEGENDGGTTGGTTGGVVEFDLCVVKRNGKVKYSCKPMQGERCESPRRFGTSVSCNNAKEC